MVNNMRAFFNLDINTYEISYLEPTNTQILLHALDNMDKVLNPNNIINSNVHKTKLTITYEITLRYNYMYKKTKDLRFIYIKYTNKIYNDELYLIILERNKRYCFGTKIQHIDKIKQFIISNS